MSARAVTADAVPDPYRWLEDPSTVETVAWLERQRELVAAGLDGAAGRPWFERTLGTLAAQANPKPRPRVYDSWSLRVRLDAEHPTGVVQVLRDPDAGWTLLFDPSRHHAGGGAVICRWDPSPAGRFIAVQVVLRGNESVTPLHIVDAAMGATVGAPMADVRYTDIGWLDDERFVYARPDGVHLHTVGRVGDPLLFGLPGTGMRYHPKVWHKRWMTVSARVGTASHNTLWWAELTADGPPWPVLPVQAEPDALTSAVVRRTGGLVLATTWSSDRGQVVACESASTDRSTWRRLVAEDPAANLNGCAVVDPGGTEHLIVLRTRTGGTELTVHDPDSGALRHAVPMPGGGTVTGLVTAPDGHSCSFTYTDWITPRSSWTLDPALPFLEPLGGGPSPHAGARVETVSYPSTGGVRVPLTLITPAGGSGPRPTLLTAYGGFNVAFRPSYQPEGLAWVLAGGTVAVADVRGGGGRGRAWHLSGTRANKQNSFDDLRAAAVWLVDSGHTPPDGLVLLGASNGGLLVTGALVQRPDLFSGAVAVAPLTDMVRYELFGLGPAWAQEYGTAADPEQLAWLLGYSPYHNVRPGRRYPPLLLITGDNDTRVDPLHARKLCAMLQSADPGGGPTLLHVAAGTGHGSSSADHQVTIGALALSFLARHAGLRVPADPPLSPGVSPR